MKPIDQKTKTQLVRFLLAGIGAVGTDTLTYFLLIAYSLNSIGYDWAKLISFLAGSLVAFVVNKFWTFESKGRSVMEIISFFTLYTLTLGLNVAVNRVVLIITDDLAVIAFLIATGCSTVANFIGQKYWVFRVKNQVEIAAFHPDGRNT